MRVNESNVQLQLMRLISYHYSNPQFIFKERQQTHVNMESNQNLLRIIVGALPLSYIFNVGENEVSLKLLLNIGGQGRI